MNYSEAREYLKNVNKLGSILGLNTIKELLKRLGNPQNELKVVHSTDHLRLKSLVLGVNAPDSWIKKLGLSRARVYFSGSNLLTWAKYTQYDPELMGTVGFEIPPLKTFSFGLEIGL